MTGNKFADWPLTVMTAQEVFDFVARHLLTQGKRATLVGYDNALVCAYRSSDGCKCAAGCLIPDSKYDQCFEGEGWAGLVNRRAAPGAHEQLIAALQFVHDGFNPDDWCSELAAVAHRYHVSAAVLKDFEVKS